ncbi:MAG: methyltransferase domain-containing protein [Ilumatobacter sp.]
MRSTDAHGLGYRDVDGDPHTAVLVGNMNATAGWPATQRLREWERQQLGLVDGERLLDVGCGRGEAAISLGADLGANGELVGIDASNAMLEVAGRRGSEVPCAVRFSVGDARSLAEANDSFDAVRSERTLQWLPDPSNGVVEMVRVLRSRGRLSLIDTDWSTLLVDVGDPKITSMVTEGLRVERNRPSNVGRRLAVLATAADCEVTMETTDTQVWTEWNPDESPAPDGCFSMASLADDLVENGQLQAGDQSHFVDAIHEAARRQRFKMLLTMHAAIAVRP